MTARSISIPQPVIEATAALQAVQAAVKHAQTLNLCIHVAVVDRAGWTVASAHMAGTSLHSANIAADKAYTAASFGLPSGQWQAQLAGESAAIREGLLRQPRFVAFGGGFPVVEGEHRIGGIGVSGGSEQQDEAIALAGLSALGLRGEGMI